MTPEEIASKEPYHAGYRGWVWGRGGGNGGRYARNCLPKEVFALLPHPAEGGWARFATREEAMAAAREAAAKATAAEGQGP
jgi:hypothetical protein